MKHTILALTLLLFTLAACQTPTVNKEATIESLSAELEANPHSLVLLENRKDLYIADGQKEKAIADLQHCINLAVDSSKYYVELADLFMEKGDVNNTLALLEKASKVAPKDANIWVKVSEIYLLYKKYQDVIKFANKALDVDPYNDQAFFIKGYAFKEGSDTTNAIANFRECLKNNPENINANIELGFLYSVKKDDLAITYFNNALKIDSTNMNANYNLGLFYQNNDYLNEAIEVYKEIIENDPSFAHSYFNIGYIYLELLNIPDMGADYFTQAIEKKADFFEAYYNRGLCYEEVGNVMQAIEDFKMALQISPNYDPAISSLNRVEKTINEK